MSDFKVSTENGLVRVHCNFELPETDIVELLSFDENQLEDLYRDHAATQAYWEQMAINLKNDYEKFSEEFEKKWWAHNKRFAKFVLQGYGEKTITLDSLKDMTILICSQDTSVQERERYASIAYKTVSKKGLDFVDVSEEDFIKQMYKYLLMSPSWYFETVSETSKWMEKNYLTIANIAKRLDSRSFHMKELTSLLMAKSSNVGPMTYKDSKRERELMNSITVAKSQ